jgi:hypothetical protein
LLAPIVRESVSFSDVLRRLGLRPTGGNHRHIAARIREAGLDTSHFGHGTNAEVCRSVSPDVLAEHVRGSTSIAEVFDKLGLPRYGGTYRVLVKRIAELGIDTSHLRGHGWARGETKESHPAVARVAAKLALADADVFVENSPFYGGKPLTPRLLRLGWKYECKWCGLSEWRGQPLVLHLDHINGIHNDNRFENLRFLCPNCHSQTETYGNRRRPSSVV